MNYMEHIEWFWKQSLNWVTAHPWETVAAVIILAFFDALMHGRQKIRTGTHELEWKLTGEQLKAKREYWESLSKPTAEGAD